MKRFFCISAMLVLLIAVSACTKPETTATPEETVTPTVVPEQSVIPTPAPAGEELTEYFKEAELDWQYDPEKAVSIVLADNASTSDSEKVTVDKNTVTVTDEGVYVITGSLSDGSIVIDAGKKSKVQLVLNNASVTRKKSVVLYVLSADKVYVTSAPDTENTLSRSTKLYYSEEEKLDAAVYSKSDIVFNGTGKLTINSAYENAITAKDGIKFTSGEYVITSVNHAIDSKNHVCIYDGNFTVTSGKDAFHCENKKDDTLGYTVVRSGTFVFDTVSDGFDSSSILTVGKAGFSGKVGGDLFKSDNGVTLDGCVVEIKANEVAVESETDVVIENGYFAINAPEAFKANEITMNSGALFLTTTKHSLVAKNGITLNGGEVFAENKNGMSAFEFGTECVQNGATLFATMGSSAQKRISSDKTVVIMRSFFGSGRITVKDEKGNELLCADPETGYSFVIISSDKLELNKKYTVSCKESSINVTPQETVVFEEETDGKERFMNIEVKPKDELVEMRGERLVSSGEQLSLYLNGLKMPYDKNKQTYYIPQDMNSPDFSGIITTDRSEVYFFEDEYMSDKSSAISENRYFYLTCYEEDYYFIVNVCFTGLPVITLTRDPSVKTSAPSEEFYGGMECFDPYSSDYYQYGTAGYRYRGASTKNYPKKSYRLELDSKLSLCGMRKDDDWVLLSLYDDCGMIRNKYSFDVWNLIAKSNSVENDEGATLHYVEVIVDNAYQGVYTLSERIDEKQLELNEDDILYKWNNWSYKDNSSIEIKYPDTVTPETWEPLEKYREVFCKTRSADMDDAEELLNMENAIDHTIFTMLAFTQDCLRKNTYLVAEKTDDGYKFKAIPWDMNGSWGCDWRPKGDGPVFMIYHTEAETDPDCWFTDMYVLFKNCPEEIGKLVYERWQELRQSVLTKENLLAVLDKDLSELHNSGAFIRNAGTWQFSVQYYDEEDIYRYVEKRLEFLDGYFAEPYLPSGSNLNF